MTETAQDYLIDVPYTPQFHPEHAPLWMHAVLAALGHKRPGGRAAKWCEVGCGPGTGLVVLAAANPDIAFHGIDINPRHIEQAKSLAERAGIANATFHCADLRSAQELPGFDYIVVRGIYSWVSPAIREAIRRFVGERLNPGGVALLHYLALPGAADLMAVHGLFRALSRQPGMTSRKAAEAGQEILAALHAGKAGFFATHPVADLKVPRSAQDDIDYVVHEYLNEHYAPLASAEVIHSMRAEGLDFVGSASPMDNLDDFSVPGSLRPLFARQSGVEMREAIRDLAGNQFSRVDLYMRAARPLRPDEHFGALRSLRFRALPQMPTQGSVTFDTLIGPVQGPAAVFSPILERFLRGDAVSYAEIEALPVFAGKPGLVNQALHAMMGARAIHPVPVETLDPEPARRLNRVLLEDYGRGWAIPALSSPALGSGLSLGRENLESLARGGTPGGGIARLLP